MTQSLPFRPRVRDRERPAQKRCFAASYDDSTSAGIRESPPNRIHPVSRSRCGPTDDGRRVASGIVMVARTLSFGLLGRLHDADLRTGDHDAR